MIHSFLGQSTNKELRFDSVNPKTIERREECLTQMEALSFFRLMSPSEIQTLKARFRASGNIIYDLFDDSTRKANTVDFENVRDDGVPEFLRYMGTVLAWNGLPTHVDSEEEDDNDPELRYIATINQQKYVLWDIHDVLATHRWQMFKGDWLLSGQRCIMVINDLLRQVDIPLQAYYHYNGHSSQVVLLTGEQYRALLALEVIRVSEEP